MWNALKTFSYKIQNLMDLFYYYYYRFYKYKLKEDDAHMTTVLSLAAMYTQIFVYVLSIIILYLFKILLSLYVFAGIWILVIILLYYRYVRKGLGAKIIKEKAPVIMGSEKKAIICSLGLFIVFLLAVFGGAYVTRYLYNR